MVKKIIKTMPALAAGILLVSFSLCGCGKGSQQPDTQLQSAQQEKSQEKESEKLKNIEARLETLIETLGGPSVKMEESQSKESGGSSQKQQGTQEKGTEQQSTQQQGTQEQGTQQQSTQQQGGQQQDTQEQGTKQQSTQQQGTQKKGGQQQGTQQKGGQQQDNSKWNEVDMLINNLHYQWNDFMPDVAKKGADMKLVDNFDNALNSLTTTVAEKDSKKILGAANALYSHIPDLYSLYRTKMSPEAKRMVYYTRNIILESAMDNWEQVKKDDKAIEKSWSLFRNSLEKEQQEIGDKLNFSIYELNKVVLDKNKQLSDIKGRIVLSNIKELQKSFEEKK